ncbi:maleylacetate reductase [Nocardia carnea]|uniref:maleylacetate reductase n=1 Tax=Nocardia carnea TaxID=37328 RepID=UPI002457F3FF|nr:maleylacetate reductase [Nocardia carnea]
MLTFTHRTLGQRVLFGEGQLADHLLAEVNRLDAQAIMLIAEASGRARATQLAARLPQALIYDRVAPHVPRETAEHAQGFAVEHGIDLLVSIGGGSATGLAKAVALSTGIPIVAIPTTYAGSEATNVWGLTENARKTTGVDDRVLPTTVIYDVALTYTLPVELSVASGLNALAHCVDSMWAPRTDPIDQAMAIEGIRALSAGLPAVKTDPHDRAGREQTLYGAYLSAVAFSSAGSGLHHKICHVLGGAYNLPHAQTHAVILPHVLAYLAPAAPAATKRIAAAFGSSDAVAGLNRLREALDAPIALADYGFDETVIDEAAQLILPVVPENTPRDVGAADLAQLLRAAWAGDTPTSEVKP